MNLIEKLNLIQRLDYLIQRKATGSPTELSKRLKVSKRNVFNIINTMKEMGAPICFCSHVNSYYYESSVRFTFGFNTNINKDIKDGIRA